MGSGGAVAVMRSAAVRVDMVMMVMRSVQVVMRVLVRSAILVAVVMHVRTLTVFVRMLAAMVVVMRRAVRMHMIMFAMTMRDGLAVYRRFAFTATAYVTHLAFSYSTSSSFTRISFPPVTCT
jgi:hypothetical protein